MEFFFFMSEAYSAVNAECACVSGGGGCQCSDCVGE